MYYFVVQCSLVFVGCVLQSVTFMFFKVPQYVNSVIYFVTLFVQCLAVLELFFNNIC